MKYIFLILLVSTSAFSSDCLKEYYNYHTGMKFTGSFNDLYETHKANPDLKVICKDKNKNELWESERKSINASFIERKDELNKSLRISTGELDLLNSEEAVYIGEPDICARLDRAIKEKESCYEPIAFTQTLRKSEIMSMTFEAACLKFGPEIIRRIRICKYKN